MATSIIKSNADYIVEQGTSGIWEYRKWSDGTAECWGSVTKNTTYSSWASGIYYGTTYTGNQTYPTNLFIAEPSVTATLFYSGGSDAWLGMDSINPSNSTRTPSWYPVRIGTYAPSSTYKVGIHAIGKWK